MKCQIPKDLETAICKDELIIFVGAGLSFNLLNIRKQQLKGWANLVHEILAFLRDDGHEVDHLIPLVKRYEPIKVLDLLENDKQIP